MSESPGVRVREVRLLERPLRLRLPFRYGAITLREAREVFVRVRAERGRRSAWGVAAELLAPKWFDKDPRLDDEDNVNQLRASLARAATRCVDAGERTPFALALGLREPGDGASGNGLVDGFGPALLDRAVLDAAARLAGTGLAGALRGGAAGIDLAALAPDLRGFDTAAFLDRLHPAPWLDARHTVGLADPLDDADVDAAAPADGLPVSLVQVVACYGNRWFKVKIGGDADAAAARLARVARTLDAVASTDYRITVDANEQYPTLDAFARLLARLRADPALAALRPRVAFIEQPLDRALALDTDVASLDSPWPLLVDESDDGVDAFPRARARGYRGVSAKQCKGFYKAIANAARCAMWNAQAGSSRFFLSAEDLSCQGGVSVQQDLAVASLLGVTHAERNGHHFGGAMPGAGAAEQRAFLAAHPDLYQPWGDGARLRITRGRLQLGSLGCEGFGHGADPQWSSMSEMPRPPAS